MPAVRCVCWTVLLWLLPLVLLGQSRLVLDASDLRIVAARNDRMVGTTGRVRLGATVAQHIELRLEGSSDSSRWERVADKSVYLVPQQPVAFRFGGTRNPKHRYYRLIARDPQYRTLAFALPALQLANAVHGVALARPDKQTAVLTYELARRTHLLLRVYNRIGEEIDTRALPDSVAGRHTYPLDCRHYRAGNYLLVITQVDTNHKVAELRLEL